MLRIPSFAVRHLDPGAPARELVEDSVLKKTASEANVADCESQGETPEAALQGCTIDLKRKLDGDGSSHE